MRNINMKININIEDESISEYDGDKEKQRQRMLEAQEITVLLVKYATPIAAITLPRKINDESALQAASPAYEITRYCKSSALVLAGYKLLQPYW